MLPLVRFSVPFGSMMPSSTVWARAVPVRSTASTSKTPTRAGARGRALVSRT
jgi:hypothetical protein